MKSLVIFAALLLLESFVHGRNAWETLRSADLTARELEEIREEKLSKTSIIVFDKFQMNDEETDAEIARIVENCDELGCPCEVIKLGKVGVLEVIWSCDNHPSVNELDLDSTKEAGAEDQFVELDDTPFPTDPRISEQWAFQDLDNNADINIAEGWEEYLSDEQGGDPNGPSVVVAVIDTGVDYSHVDLKDAMWTNPGEIAGDGIDNDGNGIVDDVYGADFAAYGASSGSGDPMDRRGHGTHCAGIIAATPNNEEGIAGVASFTQGKVKIMALKAFPDNPGALASLSGLLACLNYALEKGAKISSNSWSSKGSLSGMWNIIETMWATVLRNNLDHLYIASSGNDNRIINDDYKILNCGLKEPNLLCVAASTIDDGNWNPISWMGSNFNPEYVHVFAPGAGILSTYVNNEYRKMSGTSMACPMVSGLAALIMTMRDELSAEEVRQVIEANVRVKPEYSGYVSTSGLIDVGATIKALKGTDGNEAIDCEWGRYGVWSSCSKTCGGGEMSRSRQVEIPASNGGKACEGEDTEIVPCNTLGCPVNCEWGPYGEWSSCSKTCGEGEKYRTRLVSQPASNDGQPCEGEATETMSCNETQCPDVCFDVTITTTLYSQENSWVLGSCSNTIIYENYQTHEEECCLLPGEYTLECQDSYGDGWHGGFITINGTNYCENFKSSSQETHEVLIGSETESEKLCGDIKIRTENWGNENSYSVGTCASSQSPYSSYNDYVEECCLRPGTYTLDCKCTFGDGWHGGYLEIAGVRYCDDFLYGSTQTVAVEWGS